MTKWSPRSATNGSSTTNLAIRRGLRLDRLPRAQDDQRAHPLRRSQVNADALTVLDALAAVGRTSSHASNRSDVPRNLFVTDRRVPLEDDALGSAQVQRHSLAPRCHLDRRVVDLDAADAKLVMSGEAADPIANRDLSVARRAGDDDPWPCSANTLSTGRRK